MELTLTPRLAAVARLVHQAAHLADVGTDHAYLPVRLLLDGRIEYAIAADLREGPLSRARETAARYGVEGRISFRLCDGLSGVGREEADTVAIAGMRDHRRHSVRCPMDQGGDPSAAPAHDLVSRPAGVAAKEWLQYSEGTYRPRGETPLHYLGDGGWTDASLVSGGALGRPAV